MAVYSELRQCFAPAYLRSLRRGILSSPYFTANTLNRDFVQTKGFSLVFRADTRQRVEKAFPVFTPFLQRSQHPDCNAFYLNPLLLERGSRVDPHIDRSLRSYCKTVLPPLVVSVLYVEALEEMTGGALVLARGKKRLAYIRPATNMLISFDGDLTHSIERMDSAGSRLSLVCEQYCLNEDELALVPEFAIESRVASY